MKDWNELMVEIERLETDYAIQLHWFPRLKYLRAIMAKDNKDWEKIFDERYFGDRFNTHKKAVEVLNSFIGTLEPNQYKICVKDL